MPGPPLVPPLPQLPGFALDFSAGPSNAASNTPINVGGINAPLNSTPNLMVLALVAAAAWFLKR